MKDTNITINNGMAANLVINPSNKGKPQIISDVPVKFAQNSGC